MEREDLIIAENARTWRLTPWHGYAATIAIYLLATAVTVIAEPAFREALFISYLPAIVFGSLLGGSYAGLSIAIAGGLTIGCRLYPLANAADALALTLYVDAAVLLLWAMDLLNRAFEAVAAERDRAQLLFREAQHRTANNLMFVSAFLRAQRRAVIDDPERVMEALDEATQRLETFSQLHRQLSNQGSRGESVQRLFRSLCDSLIAAAGAKNVKVNLEIEALELEFEQTVILSLLLAEIVTNALKHAFDSENEGQVTVLLAERAGMVIFEVRDNGRGLVAAGQGDISRGAGYGILDMLAVQLGGQLTRTNESGLRTRLAFPQKSAQRPSLFGGMNSLRTVS